MKQFPTHIVAVYGVVENDQGEILLLKSRNRNVWMFPGGQVELGENLIDALVREAKEESCMDIAVHQLFSVASNTCTYPGYNGYGQIPPKVLIGFTCRYVSGEFSESDETTECLWVPKAEVLEHLTVPDFIEKYKAYLNFNGQVEYMEYVTKPQFEVKMQHLV